MGASNMLKICILIAGLVSCKGATFGGDTEKTATKQSKTPASAVASKSPKTAPSKVQGIKVVSDSSNNPIPVQPQTHEDPHEEETDLTPEAEKSTTPIPSPIRTLLPEPISDTHASSGIVEKRKIHVRLFAAVPFSGGTFYDDSGNLNCTDKDVPGCFAFFEEGEHMTLHASSQVIYANINGANRNLKFRNWYCHTENQVVENNPIPGAVNFCTQPGIMSCTVQVQSDLVCFAIYDFNW